VFQYEDREGNIKAGVSERKLHAVADNAFIQEFVAAHARIEIHADDLAANPAFNWYPFCFPAPAPKSRTSW
jgi:hypothetical protein